MIHRFGACAVLSFGALFVGCGNEASEQSHLTSVRVLSVAFDLPYATAGSTVTSQVLAYDGRDAISSAMQLYWLPDTCIDPQNGDIKHCYEQLATKYSSGVDLSSQLTLGDSASFAIPSDVTPTTAGTTSVPVFVFAAACAGHLEWIGAPSGYASGVPFGCFDSSGHRLSSDDFDFAYAEIFVSTTATNKNPVLSSVTLDGTKLSEASVATLSACSAQDERDCPSHTLALALDASQQETYTTAYGTYNEQVWTEFFSAGGKWDSDSVTMANSLTGIVSQPTNHFKAPMASGQYPLILVTRDDRGGTSWLQFTVNFR